MFVMASDEPVVPMVDGEMDVIGLRGVVEMFAQDTRLPHIEEFEPSW